MILQKTFRRSLTCQLIREERFSTISLWSVRTGGPYLSGQHNTKESDTFNTRLYLGRKKTDNVHCNASSLTSHNTSHIIAHMQQLFIILCLARKSLLFHYLENQSNGFTGWWNLLNLNSFSTNHADKWSSSNLTMFSQGNSMSDTRIQWTSLETPGVRWTMS